MRSGQALAGPNSLMSLYSARYCPSTLTTMQMQEYHAFKTLLTVIDQFEQVETEWKTLEVSKPNNEMDSAF
jgi:hypothetical protein